MKAKGSNSVTCHEPRGSQHQPPPSYSELTMDDDYESVLFVCREVNGPLSLLPSPQTRLTDRIGCKVYKVPPRSSLAGYKAQEWGDLGEPLWKGRMRIIETKSTCSIRLEDPNSGEIASLKGLEAVY